MKVETITQIVLKNLLLLRDKIPILLKNFGNSVKKWLALKKNDTHFTNFCTIQYSLPYKIEYNMHLEYL